MRKHSFPTRVFSVLLCIALLCTFAPVTSIAGGSAAPAAELFVGGVQVTADNAADVFGDGTVSYDAATTTLTLDGATITDMYDFEDVAFGIYANGDLTIDVKGTNYMNLSTAAGGEAVAGIYANGDLTVRGDGELTVIVPNTRDSSFAVFATQSLDYEITGISSLYVGAAADSYVFASGHEDITFNCMAGFYASAYSAVFAQMPTLKNAAALTNAYAAADLDNPATGKELTAANAEELLPVARLVEIEESYPFCYVAGVPVTVENASDVFGDGTVWYDLDKEELVLDNANLTDVNFDYDDPEDVSVIYGPGSLTIRLIGDNVLDASGYEPADGNPTPLYNQGLYISNSATFVGDGNLTAIAGYAVEDGSYGIYCGFLTIAGTGDYQFIGTEVADDGAKSYGIYAYDGMALFGTKFVEGESHGVFAMGETYALYAYGGTDYDTAIYEQYYSDANDESALEKVEDSTDLSNATRVFFKSAAEAEYPVLVNGVWATANNREDVLGDGTVSYDPSEYTVTLSNAQLTVAGAGFGDVTDIAALYLGDFDGETVYVYLEGDNVIDLTKFTPADNVEYLQAVETDCDVVFCGPGSLTIVCDDKGAIDIYACYVDSGDMTIENEGGFTIDLPQDSENWNGGIEANGLYLNVPGISIKAYQVEVVTNMFIADGVDCFAADTIGGEMKKVTVKGPSYMEMLTKMTEYDVWVGDTQITAQNYYNVLGDGTVFYEPYDNALFLENADVIGKIRCTSTEDFTVVLFGDNSMTVSDKDASAIYAPYLRFEGNGSLDITMDCTGDVEGIKGEEVYFENDGPIDITIDGANYADGVYAEDALRFNGNGDVSVSVGRTTDWACGIYCNMGIQHDGFGSLYVTAEGSDGSVRGIFCDGDLESSGFGVIYATAGAAQEDSYGAEILGVLNVAKGAMSSGNYYFKGETKAIETTGTPDLGDYSLSASDQASGNAWLVGPALENLDEYKRVRFNPPYIVYSVDDVFVENGSTVTVDWDFSRDPDYAYVIADADDSGNFDEMVGGGAYVADSSFTTSTNKYATSSHQWMIVACYGGDIGELGTTIVFSSPFTATYYTTVDSVWFNVETPEIGFAPSGWYDCSLAGNCKEEPEVTWYDLTEDSDGVPMAPGEVFQVGHRYGAQLKLCLEDCYVVADDATLTTVTGEPLDAPIVDSDAVYLCTVFDELVETISHIDVEFETYPDEGKTPADVKFRHNARLLSGFSVNPFAGVTYTWKYNKNSNGYDPETAQTLADDAPFVGGDYYALEATFKLKDGFVPDDDFYLYFDHSSFDWNPDYLTYDEDTNTIAFLYGWGRMQKTVSSVELLLVEPEVGCTPSNLNFMLKDMQMESESEDKEINWYKVEGDTYTPIAFDTVFEKDATYAAQVWYDMHWCYVMSSNLTATVNGNEATVLGCGGDEFEVEMVFGPLTEPQTVETMDVTIIPPIVGQTVADAMNNVSTDCEALAYYTFNWYVYDEVSTLYNPLSPDDVFEEDKIYGMQVDFSLKSGYVGSEDPAFEDGITVNGKAPEAMGIPYAAGMYDEIAKTGYVCWSTEAIPAPEITLTAPATTEFTFGDEALKSVQCGVAYNFAPTVNETDKQVLVNVVDANDVVVYSAGSVTADTEVTVDLSAVTAGTYTMTVAAYFYDEKIVSNAVKFAVNPLIIDKIEITDADITPVYGEKAGDHLAFTLPDDCHFTATMNGWWDIFQSRILADDDVFAANGLYNACWNFVADEGYAFADDVVITINGSTDNVDTEYSYLDVSGEEPLFILSAKAVFVEGPTEPTSTETEPTATGTETEPTATGTETEPTATGTETEPTATGTEVEPTGTGTGTDVAIYGDANNDGAVNMKDVLILRKQLAGMEPIINMKNADVNGDGSVNMKDVLELRKYLANIITTLGPKA